MNKTWLYKAPLWGLIAFGFISGLQLSIANAMGTTCPSLLFLPVCYLVTVAYGLMLISLFISAQARKRLLFFSGWGIVFTIALLASIAQTLSENNICPMSDTSISIPLCYISLAISVVILLLFRQSQK